MNVLIIILTVITIICITYLMNIICYKYYIHYRFWGHIAKNKIICHITVNLIVILGPIFTCLALYINSPIFYIIFIPIAGVLYGLLPPGGNVYETIYGAYVENSSYWETMMNKDGKILLDNLDKIHTTKMGVDRIKKNLNLDVEDVVNYLTSKLKKPDCMIERKGKNWYATVDDIIITINAYSYTIITAHKNKK